MSGERLITLENAPYVISNIVRKKGTGKIIVHFVNYSEPLENIKVKVNLDKLVKNIKRGTAALLSPDDVTKELKGLSVKGSSIEFTIPELDIYSIVVIN